MEATSSIGNNRFVQRRIHILGPVCLSLIKNLASIISFTQAFRASDLSFPQIKRPAEQIYYDAWSLTHRPI